MLQSNPALVQQLRQRLMTSGMNADQIRARLRAEGYPENLLDPYLDGATAGSNAGVVNENVLSAIGRLGIADNADLDLLRCGYNLDSLSKASVLLPYGGIGGMVGADGQPIIPQPGLSGQLPNGIGDPYHALKRRSPAESDSAALAQRRLLLLQACRARLDSLRRPETISAAVRDSGLTLFGMDFFRNLTNVFAMNPSAAVDPNYRLGPGDQLILILTGDVEESYTLDVTREGFVVVPQVGQISVNNLTLGQLEDVLYSRLGRVYSGVRRGAGATTRFSVSTSRIRSNLVRVTGDVVRPGAYQVSSAGTLLDALYAAGGPTDNGSLRDIRVLRNGRAVGALDFYDYAVNGNSAGDIRLENGDVVFVPVHLQRLRVVGEVNRPATYEVKPGETLADALRFASGFTQEASRARVQIERVLPPATRTPGRDREVTDVTSDAFLTGTAPAVPLDGVMLVRVFPGISRLRGRATVSGNVHAPGVIGVSPGLTVAGALKLAGGVRPDTYLGEVLITRLRPDSTWVQLRATLRDTTGAVLNDFAVQEDDDIHVFSTSQFRPDRYVTINGEVHGGGRFPYREGMTVRDLVLLAGGLEQSAYLNEAKIARLPERPSASRTATEFRIRLDSSYLFERGPDGRYLGPPGLPAPNGPAPEVVLKPYDHVLILRQPNWELQRTVSVAGEVRFPGRYALVDRNEKLSDVIRRAGGLTPEGYANGVIFYRPQDGIGRVGIQLPRVLRNPRDHDNILLQDGDSIYIPRYIATVSVQGAVNSPVAVTWVPGQDLSYYVRAAGGSSRNADVKRAYVRQPNGTVDAMARRFLVPDHSPKPLPGSVVFVPERDPKDTPLNPIAVAGAVGGILSSLVAVVVALTR